MAGDERYEISLLVYGGALEEFDIVAREAYIVGRDIVKMNGFDPVTRQEKAIFYRMDPGDQVIMTSKTILVSSRT
jgi:hypothetical protein